MRKLIVKYYALSYNCVIFGRVISFVRLANVIVPLFFLNGILTIWDDGSGDTLFQIIAKVLLVLSFLPILYLRYKPVKFGELDDSQKWQYGNAIIDGNDKLSTTLAEYNEWEAIDDAETERLSTNKPSNVIALLINPICLLIFIVLYLFSL